MQCPQCEHENLGDSLFCTECGARIEAACPACGAGNPPGAKFCRKCGQSVSEAETRHPTPDPRSYTPKHLAEKILTSRSALEGERKQVTVLFADVKGSMELAEQVDPEEWHRIMDRFFAILSEGVHRFEGTVNQYTGDGIMALFGAPIAHEDHAQRACYAALHLGDELRRYSQDLKREQGLGFSVRMGINSGEVVVGKIGDDLRMDYTAQGQTVGLAARMQELASPDTVYLTNETALLVSGYLNLDDLGAFKIKGAREPVAVFQLTGMGPLRSRFDVARARGLTRFVGREDDMQALESALARCREGNGQVVGVVGEAGVGKSRLCFEFLQRCGAAGLQVLEGRGVAHGKNIPLLPVLQIFRAYFGITEQDDDRAAREKIAGRLLLLDEGFREVLPLLFEFLSVADREHDPQQIDPEGRQQQLFGVLRRLVHSGRPESPTVTLIEDLHWIDGGSEAWLAEWVDAIAGSPGLLLVNFRPEYHADWMQKSYYRQLPLAPLGAEAIRQLLDDLLGSDPSIRGLAEAIHQRTGGNPFFTEEVVQSLIESGHLEGSRGSYRLVTPVAELVIPNTVQSMLAARIDRLRDREKQVLQTAAVIGKEFSEPILGAVMELSKGDLAASLSVLKGAEFIYEETLYPEAEYAFKHPLTQEVAYQSQLTERRARIHAAAAGAIERRGPGEENAALVAQHWEAAGDTSQAARWCRRAARWTGSRDPDGAAAHWRRVRRHAREIVGHEEEKASLALDAALGILSLGSFVKIPLEEARDLLEDGRALSRQLGDRKAEIRLMLMHAVRLLETGDLAGLRQSTRQAQAFLGGTSEPELLYLLRAFEGVGAFFSGETVEALRLLSEATEIADANPGLLQDSFVRRQYFMQQFNEAATLARVGRLSAAVSKLEAARQLARSYGDRIEEFVACYYAVFLAWYGGDASYALRQAQEHVEVGERLGLGRDPRVKIVLGTAYVVAQNWTEAASCLEEGVGLGREIQRLVELEPLNLGNLAQAYLGLKDWNRALSLAQQAIAVAQAHGNQPYALHGYLVLARVLLRAQGLSALPEIEEALRQAARLIGETGVRAFEPLLHEEHARLAGLRGDNATRERELREAHCLFSEMGAMGHAERLAKELKGAQAPKRKSPAQKLKAKGKTTRAKPGKKSKPVRQPAGRKSKK